MTNLPSARIVPRPSSLPRWVVGAAALFTAAPLSGAIAQSTGSRRNALGAAETMGPLPNDHRFRWMTAGAAIGSSMAVGYYYASERGERAGKCGPWNCALPYLSVSGALTGLFMAREFAAQRRANTPRAGDALVFTAARLRLPAEAIAVAMNDSLVFAVTDSGVQVLSNNARPVALQRRGAGLSLRRRIAVSNRDASLLIGTGNALWQTPIASGRLARVLSGAVDAMAASNDIVLVAEGARMQIRRLQEGTTKVDTLVAPGRVSAAHYDEAAQRWWVSADSGLYEVMMPASDAEKPSLIMRTASGGQANAIASGTDWIAAASGTEGVIIWTRDMLAARPAGVQQQPWRLKGEPRFAFDMAFMGNDLFVAGGVDGVTRIQLLPTPSILGASRQAGYASTIVARNGVLWVGDRNGMGMVRLVP